MKRAQFDTAIWHVMARGTRRLDLFRDAEDYQEFLQILSFALKKAGAKLWAYTLMTNHYHMVIEACTSALSRCMHRLNKMYSLYHNKRYGLVGHLFDGPFQAFPQKSPLLSLATFAYVFANPVKAGICSSPQEYAWSSFRSFVGRRGSPLPLETKPFLDKLDPDPERVWRLFHLSLRRELRRPTVPLRGRPTMADVHLSQFAWLLDYARSNRRAIAGEDPLAVSVYWGRQSGIAPRVMAKALGIGSREVRTLLQRFGERLKAQPFLARCMAPP